MEVSVSIHEPAAVLAVPSGYEADWTPQPGWTFWRREMCLASVLTRTPDSSGRSVVAVPTEPYWLQISRF